MYVVRHVPLRLTMPFSNFLSLPGFAILCTITVITALSQARGHGMALQCSENPINKTLLQANELASKFKN